ncbi:uncharacterized protein PRCAT00001965001 [Priceomyces carsonii]|uniref:uncharacterized protein n=1 Tax=Priceomyces carsonii TaxID=28549 RepID=UPI002EDA0435|nr:unnamed protein product [Priceomyces carsonii]
MHPYTLYPISQLPALLKDLKVELLNHLFEPCETLSAFILQNVLRDNPKFSSYDDLIEAIRTKLLTFLENSEKEAVKNGKPLNPDISKIIAAHPRLGPSKESKTTNLSEHSSAEQRSLNSGSKEDAEKLLILNEKYEATFPGLRYVVFVNGRTRASIMENMEERIARNDLHKEREEAFNAMCDIAHDRSRKLSPRL